MSVAARFVLTLITAAAAEPVHVVAGGPPAAPSWEATDIDGRTWSAGQLAGRVVLIDFWATWCAPCLEDLPRLRALHERHRDRGLTIIGISLDRLPAREFRSWLQRNDIRWPQARPAGSYDSDMARAFGVDALPASFLIDREGRLVASHLRGAALDEAVTALLGDAP